MIWLVTNCVMLDLEIISENILEVFLNSRFHCFRFFSKYYK